MIFWKLLRRIFERASEKMCFEIKDFVKEKERILDFGCGSGIFAKKLEEILKVKVIGTDILDQRIVEIPFKIFNGKRLSFKDNSFDTVLLSFVLHHTTDPVSILKEAKRVGKKIIIFEDIPENLFSKIRCKIHLFFWQFFLKEKSKCFSEKDWEEIFQKLGLKLIAKKDLFLPLQFLDPTKRKIFILEK